MSDWAGLAWLVVLLVFNGFFVASEFAVIFCRRSQIEPLAEKGSRAANTMEHATLMPGDLPARHHDRLAADPEHVGTGDPPPAGPLGLTGWEPKPSSAGSRS